MDSSLDDDMSTSRSPSPMRPPPTPAAPGPRATALQKLYADAIAHVLKTCSYTNFSSCFPTTSREVPSAMRLMHEQFISKLGDSMHKEFGNILSERNVIPSLNELDRLIEDAKRRKSKAEGEAPVPPHTLPAKQLYISHLAPALSTYSAEMRSRQETLAVQNQDLLAKVAKQRNDIKMLMEGLENVVGDLNTSVEALKPEEIDALRNDCRDMDEETR